jgi:hypothetical protein
MVATNRLVTPLGLLAALVIISGCNGSSAPTPNVEASTSFRPSLVAEQPGAAEVDLKVLKYKDLSSEVRALRGKVVVVDVWGEF